MKQKSHGVLANSLHFLGMAYKHYKIVFVFFTLHVVTGAILPLMGLYLPRLAVGLALENHSVSHVMLTLGGFASAFVILTCINGVAGMGRFPFQNTMRALYNRILFLKALECDYNIMEGSQGQSWYSRAFKHFSNGDASVVHRMINGVQNLVSGAISFVFLTGLLAMLNPLIVLMLVILSAIGYGIGVFPRRFEEKQREASADVERKFNYLQIAMSNVNAAKDMRLYNLSKLIVDVKGGIYKKMYMLNTRLEKSHYLAGTLNGLLNVIRDGVAYGYCIWQVLEGNISIPEFALFMGAITAFSSWLGGILYHINELKQANIYANEVRQFIDHTTLLDPENPTDIKVLGDDIGIQFVNVSFSYGTRQVLKDLNFTISPKEKVALVGVNGAGKTTIVKLLCGFYKATTGEILLNGYNINQFKRVDLYKMFSAVFQDICILPFTVAQNIAFDNAPDTQRILNCLEAAGIKEDIMKHPKGLDAIMTKAIDEDGIVLSGGQQQKFTIARALYKNSPILILDEPTAALDPIAESEVYESFHALTANKTALYISHRLASTRFCHKILMLKDGQIVENGHHEALMTQDGEYANMYNVQSHYYKKEVTL